MLEAQQPKTQTGSATVNTLGSELKELAENHDLPNYIHVELVDLVSKYISLNTTEQ